jgi:WD40 repeat protein
MHATSLDFGSRELREEIDAALEELPEPLREAVILCHLEGRDQQSVARQAGCSQATISRRSAEGLSRLREVLQRRGITAGTLAIAGFLAREAAAAAPWTTLSAGQLLATAGSSKAAGLADAAWRSLFWSQVRLKLAALGLVSLLIAIAAVALIAQPDAVAPAREAGTVPLIARKQAVFDHSDRVTCVAFSPSGKQLASAGADRRIHLYDRIRGVVLAILTGHRFPIKYIAFSALGDILASGDVQGEVKLWDTATGEERLTLRTGATVHSIAFSPDSRTLAIGFAGGDIALWDVPTRRRRALLSGHSDMVHCLTFSGNGQVLASGSRDRTVRLWDVAAGEQQSCFSGQANAVCAVAFSPDGKTLAAGSGRSLEEVWAAMTVVPPGSGTPPTGRVTLWDVATGQEKGAFTPGVWGIYSLAFAPRGNVLALGSGDAQVQLWDVNRRCPVLQLRGHQALVRSLSFSPDGKTLASASHDLTVCLWDVRPSAGK